MPSYEFRCLDCKRRFDVSMSYSEYGKKTVLCPFCKSENVQRKIGRIRVARTTESRMENLADPSKLAALEDDPRALGNMMREMSSEMGEDMGSEFSEVVDRLEAGQSPEQIERDLPDIGGDSGGDDFGGMDF